MSSLAPYAYLIVIVLAWGVAHGIKYVISRVQQQEHTLLEKLFMSGGMPSSHSAVITGVTTLIGLKEGVDSALFGLAVAVTLVVIYDAAHVRRMAGTTARSLYGLAELLKKKIEQHPVYNGHTIIEVAAGTALGVVLALVVFFATQ